MDSGAVTTTMVPMAVEEHGQGQQQQPTSEQTEVELGTIDGATAAVQCARRSDGVVEIGASGDNIAGSPPVGYPRMSFSALFEANEDLLGLVVEQRGLLVVETCDASRHMRGKK